jgi:hypothetical protein
MNFKKLPKEKKQHLILIGIITVGALAGLGLGVVKQQYGYLGRLAAAKVSTEKKLHAVEEAVKRSKQIEGELDDNRRTLAELENDVAEGDLYSWVINMLRKFTADYKVEIPQKSGISGPNDVTMLPKFPYKQASITVLGTAHYHDLGRFIADFENQFPHMRLLNLALEMAPATAAGESEMLSFKLEIVTLVKPNAS